MLDASEPLVLAEIGPRDVVLDIGGWARPFNRANYVIDQGAYETRGRWYRDLFGLGPQGGQQEYFTRDTWITRDICSRDPYPFPDKSIDYVICSHTLEDVRDPIWVCSEMNRIAKRGYIEVPSRLIESTVSATNGLIVGSTHHRWLIDIDQETCTITFTRKSHLIHSSYRYHLPASYSWRTPPDQRVSMLFWKDRLQAMERLFEDEGQDLLQFVRRFGPPPKMRYTIDNQIAHLHQVRFPGKRLLKRVLRHEGAER
jgi:hypothetical protein